MSKGVTNAIHVPRKVLAQFKGKFYQVSGQQFWLCLDSDQIAPFQEFMADMTEVIACYAGPLQASKTEARTTPYPYVLVPSGDQYNSEPSLTKSMHFQYLFPAATTNNGFFVNWNDTGSYSPSQTRNTYAANTNRTSGFTNGQVGYLSLIKITI